MGQTAAGVARTGCARASNTRRGRLNAAAPRIGIGIERLAHSEAPVVARIRGLVALAHAQERQLLFGGHAAAGVTTQAVARAVSAEDIAVEGGCYFGALRDGDLLGVLSVGADNEAQALCIQVLAVHPGAQRQGVGRQLVQAALAQWPDAPFTVVTPAGNAPALALYRGLGFVPLRSGVIGPDELSVIQLRRGTQPPDASADAG